VENEHGRRCYNNPNDSLSARTKKLENGCVVWEGSRNRAGYGSIYVYGKMTSVHRYAWECANGPIPGGMHVDHLCWNTSCVNVEHLRLVTNAQNQQNRSGAHSNSKSGIRGVSFNKARNKWAVYAQVNGKNHYGGLYEAIEDATEAAIALRRRLMPFSPN
jgi:hypothetical protein